MSSTTTAHLLPYLLMVLHCRAVNLQNPEATAFELTEGVSSHVRRELLVAGHFGAH